MNANPFRFICLLSLACSSLFILQSNVLHAQEQITPIDYSNSLNTFRNSGKGHVAFMGGSITEMNGYRPIMMEKFKERFPDTEFTFTNAGIASTCSTTGAFRVESDLFAEGPVDLLLLEFAVNDDQDAQHSLAQAKKGFEGIVSHVRNRNPNADIVVIHFCNPGMVELYSQGKTPRSIDAHHEVALLNGLAEVNVAKLLAEEIEAGTMTWEQYGGTHPKRPGNQFAADATWEVLTSWWEKATLADKLVAHREPTMFADVKSYRRGHWLDWASVPEQEGWSREHPNWSELPGSFRDRYRSMPICHADKIGTNLNFEFTGTAIGLFVLAGPDAGMVEFQIDDQEPQTVDLYHHFSKGLHYPRTVMLDDELQFGTHQVKLTVSEKQNENSQGHAIRILKIGVDGPIEE